jgi:hypothetical protein
MPKVLEKQSGFQLPLAISIWDTMNQSPHHLVASLTIHDEAAAKISNRSREDFVYQTNNFLRRSCHYGPGQLSKQRSMRISN